MNKTIKAHHLTFESFIDSNAILQRVNELGIDITRDHLGKKPLFLCILNGSYVFAADLLRSCDLECEVAFVRLTSYAGIQSSGKVVTVLGLDTAIKDRHIVVVEDIIDSGHTMHLFIADLQKEHPASIKVAALLLKPEALRFPVKIDYLGFEIPDRFVVGYGLDYDGLCRNLKDIYQLVTPPSP
jgi:hypoxanthine phosphoribosyltransferase